MFSLLIFLFVVSILILIHELGHFLMARKVGVRVEKFSLGFGPKLLSREIGDTEYSLNAIPLGGFVKFAGDNLGEYQGKAYEYFSKTPSERFKIIFCGPLLNYIMGFMFFWLIFFSGYPMLTTKVGGLLDGYGAKEAGLQLADKIIRVDAKKVLYWQDITKITRDKNSGDKVLLSVLRGNSVLNFQVKIKDKQFSDVQGKIRRVGLLGISPAGELVTVRHGPIQSFFLGLNETWDLTLLTYKGLWWMLSGKVSMRESVTGPLGIFFVTSKAAKVGLTAVLHLMAILSISLGLFNILPFPVLDGGHIILLGLEKLRGKALSVKTEEIVTRVGLTVLVSLVVLVTYNDILRFFGESISHFFK